LFRSAGFSVYLLSPLIFLYIRELLFEKGYQKYDWVHILPGIFYVIDYMPFFLLDGEAKLHIINHLKSNGTLFLHQQGYFKDYLSHMFLRNSLTVIYLIGIIIFFFKFVKFNGFLPFLENKVLLWKVLFLFYMLFTFAIPPLIALLELTPYSAENFYLILFAVMGILSLIILFFFTRKES
jgi:magnesium-transporting ATPase (P-type)